MNLKFKQWIDGYLGSILVAINVVLVRGLGLLLNRDHSIHKQPESIIVIKMLGIGSLFMSMDSLFALKRQYPTTKLILMTGKGVAAGMEPIGLFDEIWIHEDRTIFRLVISGVQLLLKSWKLKNKWILDLEVYSLLTTIFSAWTLARNRFGFQLNRVHFRNYLNTHNVFFNQFIAVHENYENLVKAMGVDSIESHSIVMSALDQTAEKKTIAINNTCSELGGHLRKIPEPLLMELISFLLDQTSYDLVLTGAPSDFEDNSSLINRLNHPFKSRLKNIAGKLSFKDYYKFLQDECAAMVSIDSAPLHMAMKFNLPTFSFWGPINPQQRFRFEGQELHFHYYLHKPCSPCIHLSHVIPCGGHNHCMLDMQATSIFPMLNRFLKQIKQ